MRSDVVDDELGSMLAHLDGLDGAKVSLGIRSKRRRHSVWEGNTSQVDSFGHAGDSEHFVGSSARLSRVAWHRYQDVDGGGNAFDLVF